MNSIAVFYADDDEDDLMLFEDAVASSSLDKSNEINLKLVRNGVNLVELMLEQNGKHNVVLLDLNMPFKTGFEILSEIRSHATLKNATVIIYSTSSDENTIRKSFEEGANFYVSKPNDYNSLKIMVESILSEDWQHRPRYFSNFVYQHERVM